MSCKYLVYADPDQQTDLEECGEPELIHNFCYDHCVLCKRCRLELAPPDTAICKVCLVG